VKVKTKIIHLDKQYLPFELTSGDILPAVSIAYEEYGKRNESGDNTILVCHALTGESHAAGISMNSGDEFSALSLLNAMKDGYPGWWDGMIGPDKPFDTNKYHIICTNILGSCYGTTGPLSINPVTDKPYMSDFPIVTVRDMVKLQHLFLQQIGINKLLAISGGSLGGMQTLEWAVMYPDFVKAIIPIATAARHSDWCIGINHLARQAIQNDPEWNSGQYKSQPKLGLGLAREIAMISYRADTIFNERFDRNRLANDSALTDIKNKFQVESYLKYQGEKLVKRFDANTYIRLSHAMDLHDVGLDRGGTDNALGTIKAATLCIGIDSDILYPAHEQRAIAARISNAQYAEIKSKFGHDAFLVEFEQMRAIIGNFLDKFD
jgi:homoserine O-acetyltransferase/O-succinyltransferase